EQERDHDQGENQKLSLYQAFSLTTLLADYLLLIAYKVAKAEEDNDEKHKPSTQALSYHNVSQQEFRVVIPRPKLLPGLHVRSTYGYSHKWFFLGMVSCSTDISLPLCHKQLCGNNAASIRNV
ncbi:unnamed protein product, partial [Brassica rapa subsp. trilocularis]